MKYRRRYTLYSVTNSKGKSRDYETACSFLEELALDMANSKVRELWNIAKSLISLIKSRARDFRNMDNFKNMIYFCMVGFDFPFIPIME